MSAWFQWNENENRFHKIVWRSIFVASLRCTRISLYSKNTRAITIPLLSSRNVSCTFYQRTQVTLAYAHCTLHTAYCTIFGLDAATKKTTKKHRFVVAVVVICIVIVWQWFNLCRLSMRFWSKLIKKKTTAQFELVPLVESILYQLDLHHGKSQKKYYYICPKVRKSVFK